MTVKSGLYTELIGRGKSSISTLCVISIFQWLYLSYLILIIGSHWNVTTTDIDDLIMIGDLPLKHLRGSLSESFERIKLFGNNWDLLWDSKVGCDLLVVSIKYVLRTDWSGWATALVLGIKGCAVWGNPRVAPLASLLEAGRCFIICILIKDLGLLDWLNWLLYTTRSNILRELPLPRMLEPRLFFNPSIDLPQKILGSLFFYAIFLKHLFL